MDWQANWIWGREPSTTIDHGPCTQQHLRGVREGDKNRWFLFRKEVSLDNATFEGLQRATLHVSVDSRYKLWINGKHHGRGIYRCNKHNWYHDTHDITAALTRGTNAICFLVQYFGEPMSWYEMFPHGGLSNLHLGKGFLVFQLHLVIDGRETIIPSDATTLARPVDAWARTTRRPWVGLPYIEQFDARRWDPAWLDAAHDASKDDAWHPAFDLHVTTTRPRLVPCDIPRLQETPQRAGAILNVARVDPFFEEADFHEAPGGDDADPPDFFMQLAMSPFTTALDGHGEAWTRGEPVRLDLDGGPVGLVLDAGRVVSGFPRFTIDASHDGTVIDAGWSERVVVQGGFTRPEFNPFYFKHGTRYTCKAGKNEHELFHWHGYRYVQVNVYPPPGKVHGCHVTVHDWGTTLYLYPVSTGEFRCSDPRLERLHEACTWTLRNCMHDGYEDCPGREQRQWIGDAYVEVMIALACTGDTALARKLVRQGLQGQRGDGLVEMVGPGDIEIHGVTITDYSLYWIATVHELYKYTGDTSIVIDAMPGIVRVLRWFLEHVDPATGLLTDPPHWLFIDWSVNDKWGACTAANAQLCDALRRGVEMAGIAGWGAAAGGWDPAAERIADGINAWAWDEARGAYVDAVQVDLAGNVIRKSKKVSFHGNALVLLHDICPPERAATVFGNVFDRPFPEVFFASRGPVWSGVSAAVLDEEKHVIGAEPFFMHHVHQLCAKMGRHDVIMRFIEHGWVRMLDLGATTIWENWSNAGSTCHAWSATPAHDLVRHVLGVRLASTGGGTVVIAPHPCGLTRASGTVPTMKGPVRVAWNMGKDGWPLVVDWSAPPGVTVDVQPPVVAGAGAARAEPATPAPGYEHRLRFDP